METSSSSSGFLASASPEAHLRWKAVDDGLYEVLSTEGVAVAKERGLERNELGWDVRRRKAVRLNWNLGNN